jgi:peptidoglycan/xylan/chitin deacetylase (PgdA/CDA1 family)
MRVSAAALVAFTCGMSLALAACGGSDDAPVDSEQAAARTPLSAPGVELTPAEEEAWARLPPDRSAIPVLLYHGIGPESNFASPADAEYGVGFEDFARQMTMIKHAGYQTVDLETFVGFVAGEDVELPPRPLLLTFDDARADSWTGAHGILDKLGFNAVMFVDVGRVEAGDPEYLTWDELRLVQESPRWELQLHSGDGHRQIRFGPGPDDFGPFYAYRKEGEDLDGWRERAHSDIEWGHATLADNIPSYDPLAFAPPYGNYGQDGTNDPRIPEEFLPWLVARYPAIFTQDVNARAQAGSDQPLGRIQVTRLTTGGEVGERLLSGEQ